MVYGLWSFLHEHDLPNWIGAAAWPLLLFLWNRYRTHGSIPDLEIRPFKQGKNENGRDVLRLQFMNKTGSMVYLTNVSLIPSSHFSAAAEAAHNLYTNSFELKFKDKTAYFDSIYTILQTGQSQDTILAVDGLDDELLKYSPGRLRRLFRCPNFFKIKYIAMVGKRHYKVSMIF